jgi:F0F1-type ATP synthase alpha subunit
MKIRADEISQILKQQIKNYDRRVRAETGTILSRQRRHRPHLRPR